MIGTLSELTHLLGTLIYQTCEKYRNSENKSCIGDKIEPRLHTGE